MKTPKSLYNDIPIHDRLRIDVELSVVYARASLSRQALESRVAILPIDKGRSRAHREVHASKLEIARTLFSAEFQAYKPFIESETDLAEFMRDRAQAVCNWIALDPVTDADVILSDLGLKKELPPSGLIPASTDELFPLRRRQWDPELFGIVQAYFHECELAGVNRPPIEGKSPDSICSRSRVAKKEFYLWLRGERKGRATDRTLRNFFQIEKPHLKNPAR